MFTEKFSTFVRPAQEHPQIWRLLVGSVLIVFGYLLGIAAIFAAAFIFLGETETIRLAYAVTETSGPAEVVVLLFSFGGALISPLLVVRWIHKQHATSLFGPRHRVFPDFAIAALVLFAVNSIVLVGWFFWFDATPNLSVSRWVRWLPLVVIGLLIQTLAEESVFRGYLQQQLAARFNSPLVWMLLPALAFGALHIDPASMGANTWLVVGSTVVFALLASDLVRITGNIGAAWGFHFANNFIVITFLSTKGSITGASLFLTPYQSDDPTLLPVLLAIDIAVMFVCWLILRRILQR